MPFEPEIRQQPVRLTSAPAAKTGNFCQIHGSLRVSSAMEAGITDKLRDIEWIVQLIDENTPKPKKPGPKKGTKYRPHKSK